MTAPDPTILAAAIKCAEEDLHLQRDIDDPEVNKVRALVAAAKAYADAQEDAARWRALMSSQRVRVIGSAGMVDPATGALRAPADGYVHIGIEFWSLHNAPHPSKEFPQDRCRGQLTFYADFLRANPPAGQPEIPLGVYYRAESDNFYDMTANVGMGMGFWTKWRARKHEFPTERGAPAALNPAGPA